MRANAPDTTATDDDRRARASARDPRGTGWARSWEWRAVTRLRLPPALAGLLLFSVLVLVYALAERLFGVVDSGPTRFAGPLSESQIGFTVGAAVAGYSLAAGAAIAAGNAVDVAKLRTGGALRGPPGPALRAGRVVGAIGLLAAFVFMFFADESAMDLLTGRHISSDGFFSVGVLLLAFWLASRASWFTLADLANVARTLGRGDPLDPLDSIELEPLGRMALRAAVLWAGAAALGSLSLVLTRGSLAELVALGFLLAVAAGSFWIPVRGVHANLRAAKRTELDRVRGEIRRDREAVAALGPDSAAAARRLPGLLAFEARVESAREWPFDASTLRRFGIILLLPLLSWLGGALVERAVDRLLD
ncbi:MAG: hypothetical protein ACQGVK_02200 [Myxococcota bacterium]